MSYHQKQSLWIISLYFKSLYNLSLILILQKPTSIRVIQVNLKIYEENSPSDKKSTWRSNISVLPPICDSDFIIKTPSHFWYTINKRILKSVKFDLFLHLCEFWTYVLFCFELFKITENFIRHKSQSSRSISVCLEYISNMIIL